MEQIIQESCQKFPIYDQDILRTQIKRNKVTRHLHLSPSRHYHHQCEHTSPSVRQSTAAL